MKNIIIITISLIIGFGAGYFIFVSGSNNAAKAVSDNTQLYTCGMHPEIISEEPGYCPLCGMKLTPKKDGAGGNGSSITIDPVTTHNIGLTTETAQSRIITKTIRAFGKIEYAEPMVKTVNLKTSGWAEKLYIDYTGARVSKGQALLELYSPELVAAQREYLSALKNSANLKTVGTGGNFDPGELVEASLARLKNWDISEDQLKALETNGEITRNMVIRSPVNGIVIEKKINSGDHIMEGKSIYRIADVSEVWAVGYVYEQDFPFLEEGQMAEVRVPNLPGELYKGEITYISPFLNNKGQIEIRVNIPNRGLKLKPDMYAEINVNSTERSNQLSIPLKAVINSGTRRLVYVEAGEGAYQARAVKTGAVGDDDYVEILDGLTRGERVVTSGQFLLDSESRLSESLENNSRVYDPSDEHAGEDLTGIYTCPMPEHYHILQYGEGKCEECGMDLIPVEHTNNKGFYHCPMAVCETISDEEGRCPDCGMFLVKYEGGGDDK
ncbi:MAG: efflux RND transporter periplasmic adaptor subunit [candidate division Zixibacteria bacterium]|nr:efflux RND transporter periplasmic adaptor subunit [candidate division Zixibacteria bacterium]